MTAQGGSRVEEKWDKTSYGSHNVDTYTIGRKRLEPHRLGTIRSRPRSEAVTPEKGSFHRPAQARDTGHSNSKCSTWRHLCSLSLEP